MENLRVGQTLDGGRGDYTNSDISKRYVSKRIITKIHDYDSKYNFYDGGKCDFYMSYVIDNPDYSRGSRITTVSSTSRSTYPNSGKKGTRWYEWKGIE